MARANKLSAARNPSEAGEAPRNFPMIGVTDVKLVYPGRRGTPEHLFHKGMATGIAWVKHGSILAAAADFQMSS